MSIPDVASNTESDRRMLIRLRENAEKFSDAGYGRDTWNAIVGRFEELSRNQNSWRQMAETVADAHKLALKQLEYAQSALRQLERAVGSGRPITMLENNGGRGDLETKGE